MQLAIPDSAPACLTADFDCGICSTPAWESAGECCGNVVTENVAAGGVYLAFAVRFELPDLRLCNTGLGECWRVMRQRCH